MKHFALITILFFIHGRFYAQECPEYLRLLNKGDSLAAKGKFMEALYKYQSAQTYCKSKSEEIQERIEIMFIKINQVKINAVNSQIEAQKALQKADSANAANRELISAFYFYDNKYALTFDPEARLSPYYFIDTLGNFIKHLGRWQKATPFDFYTGLAQVQQSQPPYQDYGLYLIDTTGSYNYRLAEDTNDLYLRDAIDLSDRKISEIPQAIFQNGNQNLKVLLLAENLIEKVQPEIGELSSLEILDLHYNDLLTVIPIQIGSLKNLKRLYLAYTNLDRLPPEIAGLKNLSELDLSYSDITYLPSQIGELQNLRTLKLQGNTGLDTLPSEIFKLQNLTQLDLSLTSIANIPSQIGELENLRSLDLGLTNLNQIPPEIGGLKNLVTLDLSFTKLTSLPKQIGMLKKLKFLNLQQASETFSPSEKKKIQRLIPNCKIDWSIIKL